MQLDTQKSKKSHFQTDNSRKNGISGGIFCEKIRLRRAWYRTESDEWDRSRNRPKLNFVFSYPLYFSSIMILNIKQYHAFFPFCDLDLYGPVLVIFLGPAVQPPNRMGPDTPPCLRCFRAHAGEMGAAELTGAVDGRAAVLPTAASCSIAVRKLNIYSDSFGPALGRCGRRLVPSLLSMRTALYERGVAPEMQLLKL